MSQETGRTQERQGVYGLRERKFPKTRTIKGRVTTLKEGVREGRNRPIGGGQEILSRIFNEGGPSEVVRD